VRVRATEGSVSFDRLAAALLHALHAVGVWYHCACFRRCSLPAFMPVQIDKLTLMARLALDHEAEILRRRHWP